MITYNECPVCCSKDIHGAFSAKDHTVSKESFVIANCSSCTFLFTQDVPTQHHIGRYYISEDYISHSDTQKGLINKLYHAVRRRTLTGKKELIQNRTGMEQGRILDIGCGTGAFLHTMQAGGWAGIGLEPDASARSKAKELHNITALPSAELYNMPDGQFDAITMWHVLEHVHELQQYIDRLKELVSPDGKLFIAVPNYRSYDAAFYRSSWAAYDVPRHLWHFSTQSMHTLMQRHGLVIEEIKPMWFDSFYVSMLSEKYKNGRGNIFRAFFVGLVSNIKAMKQKDKCSSLIYVIARG